MQDNVKLALKDGIADLDENGVLATVQACIGGGMVNEQVRRYVGADHWSGDALSGVRLCQQIIEGQKRGG